MFYAAQKWYGTNIARRRGLDISSIIRDDGAQGITILDGYFTTDHAVRRYLAYNLDVWGRQSHWLVRDGDRFCLMSELTGPLVRGEGVYNAAARARLDEVDREHAAYVNAKSALRKIDEPELAALVLAASLDRRDRKTFDRRRTDYYRMLDALHKLTDPEHVREFRMKLAEQTVPR
jgi:hypothetical protein